MVSRFLGLCVVIFVPLMALVLLFLGMAGGMSLMTAGFLFFHQTVGEFLSFLFQWLPSTPGIEYLMPLLTLGTSIFLFLLFLLGLHRLIPCFSFRQAFSSKEASSQKFKLPHYDMDC